MAPIFFAVEGLLESLMFREKMFGLLLLLKIKVSRNLFKNL